MMDAGILLALIVGAVFGLMGGMILSDSSNTRYLRLAAREKERTPVKLGDGFFYVVPESEYVRLTVAALSPGPSLFDGHDGSPVKAAVMVPSRLAVSLDGASNEPGAVTYVEPSALGRA